MKSYKFRNDSKGKKAGGFTESEKILFSEGYNLEKEERHFHIESDEYYLTVSGCGLIEIEKNFYVMKPSEVIKVEKGEKHRIANVYDEKRYGQFIHYAIKIPDNSDDKIIVD